MGYIAFAAAYLDEKSNNIIKSFGFEKEDFHLTTCIDLSGIITNIPEQNFPINTAKIKSLNEWTVKDGVYLVAELSDCSWSFHINSLLLSYGAVEARPHNPHITLLKTNAIGTLKKYEDLVGLTLNFNRHVIKRK